MSELKRRTRKPDTRFDEYINQLLLQNLTLLDMTASVNEAYGVDRSMSFVYTRAKVQPNFEEWRRQTGERRYRRKKVPLPQNYSLRERMRQQGITRHQYYGVRNELYLMGLEASEQDIVEICQARAKAKG